MRAMVLAAGLGKRLRPLTFEVPKPLAPVVNRPVMEHILALLARHGHREVIANLSHLGEQIRESFGDGSDHGLELSYSEEPELLGTAGGVRNVAEFLTGGDDDSFLVISGDALTDIDLSAMRAAHESHGGIATLAVKKVANTREYGVVIHGPDGRIEGFQEKPDPTEALSDLGNAGIYMFRREIFDHFPDRDFVDWAMDVFPALLESDTSFHVHEIDAYWNDIGSLEEYRRGNFDALAGLVDVELQGELVEDGDRDDAEITGPVLMGAGGEVGAGAWVHGPVVIGEGGRIGPRAKLREVVVLPGAAVPEGAVLAGAIVVG